MKRVAESQLTKDSGENEDESQEVGTGFQKADTSALSERKMRGLPRRSAATSTPVGPSNGITGESSEPTSRFSGFTGFGSSATTAAAFTFTPPASQPPDTSTLPHAQPPVAFPPTTPASIPNLSSASSAPPNPTVDTQPSTPHDQNKRDAALKFCMSLRGLNSSFLDAATKAVQADPFVDITQMLEKYKLLRLFAQKEFDCGPSASGTDQDMKPSPASPSQPSSSKPQPSMPTPPKSFFGFGVGSSPGGPSTPHGGGFTLKEHIPSKEMASPPFGKPAENTPTTTKPFALGTSETSSLSVDKSSSGSALDADKPHADPAEPKSSGASESTPASGVTLPEKANTPSFGFKSSSPAAPLTPGFSSFLSQSKPSAAPVETWTPPPTKPDLPSPSQPSSSAFGFGTGKNLGGPSSLGSFGKGSIGNPVGFAFGSPPATPSVVSVMESTDTKVESGPKASTDTGAGPDSAATDSLLAPSNTTHDPSPAPSQGSAYDADGPGEEDETTAFETRARAYKLVPAGDKKGWVNLGSGQLKLKAHVDGLKRRILMRNSSTGQVILNFNLFPGFKVDVEKAHISFRVPGEDATAAVHRLRVPTENDATNWLKSIRKAISNLAPPDDT